MCVCYSCAPVMRINTCVTTLTPLFFVHQKVPPFFVHFFRARVHFFLLSKKKKKEKRRATAAKTHPHFTWNHYSSFGISFIIIINTYVSVKEKEESSATISETVLLA